jgi:hypothetical protein
MDCTRRNHDGISTLLTVQRIAILLHGGNGIGYPLDPTLNKGRRPAALPETRRQGQMLTAPMSVSNGLLNETALSAVSKLALTRCINMFRDRRVVPEDYPTPSRYARG